MATGVQGRGFEAALIDLIPQMRGVARALCANRQDAEDAAQEALLKALRHRDKFEPGTNLRAWVLKILRNHVYSTGKRDRLRLSMDPGQLERALVSANDAEQALALNEVRRAIAQLSPDQREVLVLVGAAGYPYGEAAEICGMPVGTVKSRVSRARESLVHLLSTRPTVHDDVPADRALEALVAQLPHPPPVGALSGAPAGSCGARPL